MATVITTKRELVGPNPGFDSFSLHILKKSRKRDRESTLLFHFITQLLASQKIMTIEPMNDEVSCEACNMTRAEGGLDEKELSDTSSECSSSEGTQIAAKEKANDDSLFFGYFTLPFILFGFV